MSKTIHEACSEGDLATVRSLVESDPTLVDADDQYEWRPIFHAALCKHVDVVKYLIDSGADISANNGYVLHFASEIPDNKAIVELLLLHGALDAHVKPMSNLSRQFLSAVFLADEARVGAMLNLHPELAITLDGIQNMPIHHAARCGDIEILKLLINAGADVNALTGSGQTVLYCAGGHGHLETVKLLLENGANSTVRFTEDGKDLHGWLMQYPDDPRFKRIAALLKPE